jgi:hypothetical protein
MGHPCKLNTMEDQELSLQFSRPRESLQPGSQGMESWPITFHTNVQHEWKNNRIGPLGFNNFKMCDLKTRFLQRQLSVW